MCFLRKKRKAEKEEGSPPPVKVVKEENAEEKALKVIWVFIVVAIMVLVSLCLMLHIIYNVYVSASPAWHQWSSHPHSPCGPSNTIPPVYPGT